MFNPNTTIIDAFVDHTLAEFQGLFGQVEKLQLQTLEQATRTALETLLNCDCAYHDISHTILVTDVGQTILHGRQLARGDLTPHDWLQAVTAMLFHDIGYLRMLLADDEPSSVVITPEGARVSPPPGSTDAFMTPYHVTRGIMFVRERFAHDQYIDTDRVAACIKQTRFPVPEGHQSNKIAVADPLPELVRCADLIGQMADPQYLQKLSRLYAEFVETGEAQRMGFNHAGRLRDGFPDFFYNQVHPYIGTGITYLKRTQEGHQWIANLYHHLHINQPEPEYDPRVRAPELIVDNG